MWNASIFSRTRHHCEWEHVSMQNPGMEVKTNSLGMTMSAPTMILTEENANLALKIWRSLKIQIITLKETSEK